MSMKRGVLAVLKKVPMAKVSLFGVLKLNKGTGTLCVTPSDHLPGGGGTDDDCPPHDEEEPVASGSVTLRAGRGGKSHATTPSASPEGNVLVRRKVTVLLGPRQG